MWSRIRHAIKCPLTSLPNLEELWLRVVLALPKASRMGLAQDTLLDARGRARDRSTYESASLVAVLPAPDLARDDDRLVGLVEEHLGS